MNGLHDILCMLLSVYTFFSVYIHEWQVNCTLINYCTCMYIYKLYTCMHVVKINNMHVHVCVYIVCIGGSWSGYSYHE